MAPVKSWTYNAGYVITHSRRRVKRQPLRLLVEDTLVSGKHSPIYSSWLLYRPILCNCAGHRSKLQETNENLLSGSGNEKIGFDKRGLVLWTVEPYVSIIWSSDQIQITHGRQTWYSHLLSLSSDWFSNLLSSCSCRVVDWNSSC